MNNVDKEHMIDRILDEISMLGERKPLIHMIANSVTAAFCADGIAAVGGRPLMAQAPEEMEEITGSAAALAVNMGQPSAEKSAACEIAMKTAARHGIPVLFDPVGAGASGYRRTLANGLLSIPWSGVIKGNGSEIHTLLTGALSHEGVDSLGDYDDREAAKEFLKSEAGKGRSLVLAKTGKTDRILWYGDGQFHRVQLPHTASRPVVLVGTGCVAGAVAGALLGGICGGKKGESWDFALAAAAALSFASFCGDLACAGYGENGRFLGRDTGNMEGSGIIGYGTCKALFLDALGSADWAGYERYLRETLCLEHGI